MEMAREGKGQGQFSFDLGKPGVQTSQSVSGHVGEM